MYTNPFNRKHSTIRQVIDRFLHPDSNNNKFKSKNNKDNYKRNCASSNKQKCWNENNQNSKLIFVGK